jgi:tRNA pseudouridine55 synthase
VTQQRRARGRDIHGILLLDKPAGMTSNVALQRAKRLFNANKAGHTGSLDPIATGLLPICLGEATKISGYLLDADKGYFVTIKLGQKTNTGDIEGDVIETRPVPEIDETTLRDVLDDFTGEIEQIPPMHSALKVDGQPLYKLAHQGLEVERQPRPVTIYCIELLRQAADEIDLHVTCSKGTYIRTLSEDIGEALGCGAHVAVLRRTLVSGHTLDETVTLDELAQILERDGFDGIDARLLPMDSALADWPGVSLSDDMAFYVKRGQAVFVPKAPTAGLVRLYGDKDGFLGIGHILEDGRVAPKRLVNT